MGPSQDETCDPEAVRQDTSITMRTPSFADLSAELAELGLSLCAETGKRAWVGIGIDEMAPVFLASDLVTGVTSFCVLGSMIETEDDPTMTLQHRAAVALCQLWNLKDQLRARDTTMKSRLAVLHLVVIPAERAIRFVFGTLVQRMEEKRRRPGERWPEWHLRTFWGALARAEAMGYPRADKMVIQKRWSCAGHVARVWTSNQTLHWLLETRDLTWWRDNKRRWRGRHLLGTQRRWEQHFDDDWTTIWPGMGNVGKRPTQTRRWLEGIHENP